MKDLFRKDETKGPEEFPPGYGKFPCIIVRIGSARYVQIPIHRNSKEEDPQLKGMFISEKEEPDPVLRKQHNLEALLKLRREHNEQHEIYLPMCLVEGPKDAVLVNEEGRISENVSIPKGGVLLTGSHKIISLYGPHYYSPHTAISEF